MGQENCHPEPGDLIEIDRGVYKHWAVYVGDGYVIHVTKAGKEAPSQSSSTESKSNKKGKVKKQLLKDVVGNNKWRANNKYDRSHIPLPVEEIIKYAEEYTDMSLPYNFLKKNCEHFATEVRYRDPVSDQVRNGVIGTSAGLAVGGGVAAAIAVAVALSGKSSKKESSSAWLSGGAQNGAWGYPGQIGHSSALATPNFGTY